MSGAQVPRVLKITQLTDKNSAMKKDLKMHPGFTIAELLVSMLIVMLVASAMVPIVGPKKLRTLSTRFNHGIAACYWDEGRLMYLYADNGPNRNASPTQMEDGATSCRYNVPQANHYTIYAVGAGADGAGNDGNGLSSTVAPQNKYNDTIGLSSFRNDIGDKVENRVGNDINSLIPGQEEGRSFQLELQDTFTDWAKSINAGRVLSHEDAQSYNINGNGRYLYAEFKGLKGPTGAGGAGYASRRNITDYNQNPQCATNPDNYSINLLQQFRGNINGELYYMARYYGCVDANMQNKYCRGESIATDEATRYNKCYFFLHTSGGNSGQPIQIRDENRPVLFPIDGDSAVTINPGAAYYYEPHFDDAQETIVSNIQNQPSDLKTQNNAQAQTTIAISNFNAGFFNSLNLWSSAPGENGGPAGDGRDGNNGSTYGRCAYSPRAGGLNIKYDGHDLSCSSDFKRGTANNGTPSGPVNPQRQGFNFPTPRFGTAGSVNYEHNNAFSWQYMEPRVTSLRYGTAGTHGDIKEMSFANLTGILTLVPGRNNNNGFSPTQVLNGNNEQIINADSQNTGGEIRSLNGSYSIRDEGGDTPRIPPERVRNLTMPNNDVFGAFLNRVRSIDFDNRNNNRLANCGQQGGMACPGYAGSGAYPVINDDIFYRLILSNNQTYARTANALEQSFTRNYQAVEPFSQEDNSITCPDGFTRKNFGNISYCTEEGARRGDGAVVIIW